MERILVAMSGGVDSAVACAVLKERGYDVAGAILVFEGVSCSAIGNARSTAEHLGISFYLYDITNEFHTRVVKYFTDSYIVGKTPNPCIHCNECIKFGVFLAYARKLGFDRIATGHYARINEEKGRYILRKGVDKNEQSYFLYRLTQKQLKYTMLPLGTMTREQVQARARTYGLLAVHKRKSQDICFIPDNDYVQYLRRFTHTKPGPIKNDKGIIIGTHTGIDQYTCGQRRGIGISHSQPYYVTRIDGASNTVYVGSKKDVYHKELIAENCNFMPFTVLDSERQVKAKVRYVSRSYQAIATPLKRKKIKVTFKRRQWAPMPGQSVVLYDNDIVLGGCIIEKLL
jgi:tRNA-specific 2-thiouridylase